MEKRKLLEAQDKGTQEMNTKINKKNANRIVK